MRAVHEGCCGLDVHKKTVVACVLTSVKQETRTFGTMTHEVRELKAWLVAEGVTHIAMESTGVYWIPIHNLLEEGPFELLVGGRTPTNGWGGPNPGPESEVWPR